MEILFCHWQSVPVNIHERQGWEKIQIKHVNIFFPFFGELFIPNPFLWIEVSWKANLWAKKISIEIKVAGPQPTELDGYKNH